MPYRLRTWSNQRLTNSVSSRPTTLSNAPLVLTSGHELKLVFPQEDAPPERFEALDFDHFFLQPMDGPVVEENTRLAVAYCLAHPRWRLSVQTHKALGIR